jgi:hypothetical protein
MALAALDRGCTLYARTPAGNADHRVRDGDAGGPGVEALRTLHDHQIAHGDLRANEITVDDGVVHFGGFGRAEYGANEAQLRSDIAQLLVTTSALYGAQAAGAAIDAFGKGIVLNASRR